MLVRNVIKLGHILHLLQASLICMCLTCRNVMIYI